MADVIETSKASVANFVNWLKWTIVMIVLITLMIEIYDSYRKAKLNKPIKCPSRTRRRPKSAV